MQTRFSCEGEMSKIFCEYRRRKYDTYTQCIHSSPRGTQVTITKDFWLEVEEKGSLNPGVSKIYL